MTRDEALRRVKGYLTDYLPIDCSEELEEIVKALEQEPCIEPLERLAESASKTAKQLERLKVSEQEPIEVEATKLQMAYNQGFKDCRKAVMDLLSEAGKLSLLAMVADLQSVNPQEPKIGHWIDDEFGSKCSCCGIYTHLDKFDRPMKFKHCSMCGAKMESEGK